MISKVSKNVKRQERHLRIRQNLAGTALRPRLMYSVLISKFMFSLLMMLMARLYVALLL